MTTYLTQHPLVLYLHKLYKWPLADGTATTNTDSLVVRARRQCPADTHVNYRPWLSIVSVVA